MTAEVVVMNKQGISMAADSAITSGREGIQKVYNTANKLFSLSSKHPIGIMIYGSASFMEVPWEVIIKTYRDHLGERNFTGLQEYAGDFFDFLSQDRRFKEETVEEIIIYRTISDKMKRLVKEVEEIIAKKKEKGIAITAKKVSGWLTESVNKKLKTYKENHEILLELNYEVFKEKFGSIVNEVKNELITYEIPGELKEKIYKLAFVATTKDFFSMGSTGFVIGGYGEDDIFPHVLNYRLEGFVYGELKYKKLKEKKITYKSNNNEGLAAIIPFAQREMIDAFIGGIEPNIEDVIFNIISRVLIDYPIQMERFLSMSFTESQVNELRRMGREIYESAEEAVKEYQQENYIEPLLGIVRALPKEELADMAEALISLTSFRRRVTRATESVGPPIDVAVITKGDGFVWMKRKNYINSEINEQL